MACSQFSFAKWMGLSLHSPSFFLLSPLSFPFYCLVPVQERLKQDRRKRQEPMFQATHVEHVRSLSRRGTSRVVAWMDSALLGADGIKLLEAVQS